MLALKCKQKTVAVAVGLALLGATVVVHLSNEPEDAIGNSPGQRSACRQGGGAGRGRRGYP